VPHRAVPFVFAVAGVGILAAQDVGAPRPPRVLHAGPLPQGAEVLVVRDAEPANDALPRGTDVLLQVDGAVPAARVVSVLAALRERGCERVQFAVALPDGTPGAVVLALPETAEPPATLTLRGHRERAGVPPTSFVRALRRLVEGEEVDGARPFVLAIEVPADTACAQLLPVLAAAASAGVRSAWLATVAAAGADGTALAFDLDGPVRAQVQPTEVPIAKPALARATFGCTLRPPATLPPRAGDGAGGRYGGRGGGGRRGGPMPEGPRELGWKDQLVRGDGTFADELGRPDPEGTLLWALMHVGDGSTLGAGPGAPHLRAIVGSLVVAQRLDGRFEDDGPGSVRRHALATYLLAEVAGVSGDGRMLMPFVDAAVRRLVALRNPDRGWSASPGAASSAYDTGWAVLASSSARFFGRPVPAEPAELLAWFDAHPSAESGPAGAELFARYFVGQDPTTTPAMAGLADLAATLPGLDDPEAVCWVTYALYQRGGQHWARWQKSLTEVVRTQATGEWRGSWDPAPGRSRLATTALRGLTLEAYYRYSRLVR
jgi:hypothetical protein